jgi:hypothetical protein
VDPKRTAGLVGSIVAGYAVMLKLVESGVFGR